MSQPDRFATQAISTLTPGMISWTIKARVTHKFSIKEYNNENGRGKWFSMYLYDGSAEIKAVAFNEESDKFYDILQEGKVYYIDGGNMTPPNEKHSLLKIGCEIKFSFKTDIMDYEKDPSTFPDIQYSFTQIKDIYNTQMKQVVDVIGVCLETSELLDREPSKIKKVTLVDQSGSIISLILRNEDAISFDGTNNPVVVLRFAVVSQYEGQKDLRKWNESIMRINLNIPETLQLREWFDRRFR